MLADCPAYLTQQPCSTWGGAIAAFEMFNVTVSGCNMINNTAVAYEIGNLSSSVAGGGCVSILFRGNSTGAQVRISDNVFVQCNVYVSNIMRGNGA
jgi:hypothetical protein